MPQSRVGTETFHEGQVCVCVCVCVWLWAQVACSRQGCKALAHPEGFRLYP